jgi:hypothetical protein
MTTMFTRAASRCSKRCTPLCFDPIVLGVAEYQLVRALPEPLDTNLPSIEEIEAELSRDFEGEENVST